MSMFRRTDFYKTLGLKVDATQGELKAAYRNLVKRWHPDMFRTYTQKVYAEQKIRSVIEAYEVLRDPDNRDEYDRYLKTLGLYHISENKTQGASQGIRSSFSLFKPSNIKHYLSNKYGYFDSGTNNNPKLFNIIFDMLNALEGQLVIFLILWIAWSSVAIINSADLNMRINAIIFVVPIGVLFSYIFAVCIGFVGVFLGAIVWTSTRHIMRYYFSTIGKYPHEHIESKLFMVEMISCRWIALSTYIISALLFYKYYVPILGWHGFLKWIILTYPAILVIFLGVECLAALIYYIYRRPIRLPGF